MNWQAVMQSGFFRAFVLSFLLTLSEIGPLIEAGDATNVLVGASIRIFGKAMVLRLGEAGWDAYRSATGRIQKSDIGTQGIVKTEVIAGTGTGS
jgi:hypothetical protein